jgi:predicted permease
LTKDRCLTVVSTLTLASGIGCFATVFTIAYGMGLRGLPVDAPDRIVSIMTRNAAGHMLGGSYLDFQDWRATMTTFTGLAAYSSAGMTVTEPDRAPDRIAGAFISANGFHLLGERPILGRDFVVEDDLPGAAPVVMLGYSVWSERYGKDRGAVGHTIRVNGVPATIIGVMREGFRFPLVHDLWQPLAQLPDVLTQTRDARTLQVVGRLVDRITITRAHADLNAIAGRLSRDDPDTNSNISTLVNPFTGRFDLNNPWNAALLAAAVVILIACANVASLLLSRSARRSREMAVRTALGAARWRIVRQLFVESTVLALFAGMVGGGFAVLGVRLWVLSLPVANWPYWFDYTMDRRVLVWFAAISLASPCVFGLFPAIHLSGAALIERVNAGGRRNTPRAYRWTNVLLVGQLALTLSLLAGAGLMARTLRAVYRADAVVDTSNLLFASLDPPMQRYATPAQRVALYERVEGDVQAIPGVSAAMMTSALPFYDAPVRALTIEGRDSTDANAAGASYVSVGPAYFDTLGVRLVRGRGFLPIDGTVGHEVTIVNQRFASMVFGPAEAIGQRIRLTNPNEPGAAAPWLTIVGVSPTVRQHYAREIDPVVYVPYRSSPGVGMTLLVRSRTARDAVTPALREALRTVDPDLPLFNIGRLDQLLSGTRFANQAFATIFGVFGILALVLSAVGLIAMTADSVAQRTQEIGVQVALGATPSRVVWPFVLRALAQVGVGLAIGLAGAYGVGQLVRSMLIQTSPHDPVTLGAVALGLLLTSLVATLVPASSALRLDPATTLRHE